MCGFVFCCGGAVFCVAALCGEYGFVFYGAAHAIGLILMPPEPLPWDRKDFFKERKHERSESLGSVARWRDSSHHRDFNRWGPAEFRRQPGEFQSFLFSV